MLLAARCDEALGEREAALARYHEVLLIDPRHAESLDAVGAARRRTLHARMESLVAERDFAAAVAALAELARLEPAAEAGAQYLYAAAVIRRDHLDDRRGALELVDRALAVAPELPRAFDTAFRLRQDTGDLAGLLRQLRGALDRLGPGDANADKARLWQQVGEIALQRGADPATALCAFSAADALVPGDRAREDLVARLSVEVGTGAVDKALAAHQRLIDREPDRPAPYHSLARLCQDIGATDRLWWTTAALIVLDDVKPDLLRFYEQHRAAQLGPVRGTITPELWTLLGHPDQDRPIEALLRLAGPALAWRTARTHAAAGLDLRRRVIAGKGQNGAPSAGLPTRAAFGPAEWFPALVLKYVARTLDVAAPDLFVDETAAAGLGSHNLRDGRELAPAFVLGPELVRRPSEPEVVFELGRATALLRPEWMLRLALPTRATLELAVRVALAVGGASSPAGDDDETQRLAGQLRATLPADAQDQLRIVARSFVADRGGVIDVRRWLAAGELGAARAALAITGDLAAAARVLGADTGPGGGISQQDRRRDLLAFAVSEEHMAVRRALGLGVAEGPTVAGSATVSTTARSSNHV
jgi:tetratricopeptide (TPR) repeat protein